MRKFLYTLLALFFAANLFADSTFVAPGPIAEQIWKPENSPYCIMGDVQVSLLTIEPGVTIIFLGDFVFEITGTLTAIGTEKDSIRFTKADTVNGWQGILFNATPEGSVLNHCFIEHSLNSGIRILNSTASIDSCTIANNTSNNTGGGIDIIEISTDTLSLNKCTIIDNFSSHHGGGISAVLTTGVLKLQNCDVISNISGTDSTAGNRVGGGVRLTGNGEFINCFIENNSCFSRCNSNGCDVITKGGGIYVNGNATLTNCTIRENIAHAHESGSGGNETSFTYGGGIYFESGVSKLINSIISCDSSLSVGTSRGQREWGSGVFVYGGTVDILNCTIVNNNTHGIRRNGGTLTVFNSIVYFNGTIESTDISGTVTATYSDIHQQDGVFEGEGNLNIHPSFNNFFEGSCINENLKLLIGSKCIDAGNPDPIYNDPEDPDNPGFALYPAMGTLRNDMGAYGGQASSPDFPVEVKQLELNLIPNFELRQNYPNPFNPETIIRYQITVTSPIKLTIFNQLGQKIKTLVDEQQAQNSYQVTWDGRTDRGQLVTSGIYFYRLKAGSFVQTRKMLLLR